MPKSVNSISCQCGGHYVKKNRSKHMETKKHQSYIQNLDFIDWDDMDFGTERSSYCGICGRREPGYFSKGELQGDIICHACDLVWIYDQTHDRYGKRRTDEDESDEDESDEDESDEEKYLCPHCQRMMSDTEECEHCSYAPRFGNCNDKECEECRGK